MGTFCRTGQFGYCTQAHQVGAPISFVEPFLNYMLHQKTRNAGKTVLSRTPPRSCEGQVEGIRGGGGSVPDFFAALEGDAKIFCSVLVVVNQNPIPIDDIGHRTFLSIRLPGNSSH